MRASARRLALVLLAAVAFVPETAQAWTIGSQLDYDGCHELISAEALRAARGSYATAPRITPTRDESALISEVQFSPPSDFVDDLAAMTLLLGVRDNDLKGHNPLDSLELVEVHGDPLTQDEHCIRGVADDGEAGNETALAACRAFIVKRATEALAGLAADGTVDASQRMKLPIFVSFAGHVEPMLPLFYVRMGQAIHAIEDGFTHTYRNADGSKVTYVTNWIDNLTGSAPDEARDGPIHLSALDHCEGPDPLVARNYHSAVLAATMLLSVALDPAMAPEAKIAAFEALTLTYLSYEPGCSMENDYCSAPEPAVTTGSGCDATGHGGSWMVALCIATALVLRRRYRADARSVGVALAVFCLVATAQASHAQGAPAIPVVPQHPGDVADQQQGKEPGREEATPTVADITKVREDKRLGSPLGVSAMLGGSFVHGAATATIGARYRLSEKWLVGADMEWNPWFTSVPMSAELGVASAYLTLVRRFPMKFDRVNLRTSVHLGVSTLLFDVNGAPKYSVGPFGSFTPLGIDYDLGKAVRLVIDPVEIAVPVPHLGTLPLAYEQFRLMIGLQIGA